MIKNIKLKKFILIIFVCLQISCNSEKQDKSNSKTQKNKEVVGIQNDINNLSKSDNILNPSGMTIETRYNPPKGYKRVQV